MRPSSRIKALVAVIAATLGVSVAQASLTTCPANITTNVSGAAACEYSQASTQDFLNTAPMTVNADGFFSFTDWVFAGKIGETAGFDGSGSGMSGTWSIPQLAAEDIMLVFKSGSSTTLVGYLLADGIVSGDWSSPFENPPFVDLKNTKNVSHISVYTRGTTQELPAPSPLALMALPLVSLLRRRKR